jgi:hypothetical protein
MLLMLTRTCFSKFRVELEFKSLRVNLCKYYKTHIFAQFNIMVTFQNLVHRLSGLALHSVNHVIRCSEHLVGNVWVNSFTSSDTVTSILSYYFS